MFSSFLLCRTLLFKQKNLTDEGAVHIESLERMRFKSNAGPIWQSRGKVTKESNRLMETWDQEFPSRHCIMAHLKLRPPCIWLAGGRSCAHTHTHTLDNPFVRPSSHLIITKRKLNIFKLFLNIMP